MNSNHVQVTPQHPAETLARQLLEAGHSNEAMAYFHYAAQQHEMQSCWQQAGDCFAMSAYCYEIDGRFMKAAGDYDHAAQVYRSGELFKKVTEMEGLAAEMRSRHCLNL